jgi:hypothetical protein
VREDFYVPDNLEAASALAGALTPGRLNALMVLTERPARRSSRPTSYLGVVYWQSADWLADHDLATVATIADGVYGGRQVTITDLGRWVLRRRLDGTVAP